MLEVGDVVIYDDGSNVKYPESGAPNGLKGIVKAVAGSGDGLDYAVSFNGFMGHTCLNLITETNGFWCGACELTKVTE